MRLIVIAKAPAAGRAKTRLCPPCTPAQAADLAAAALRDTLDVVQAVTQADPVLVLDGDIDAWTGGPSDRIRRTGGPSEGLGSGLPVIAQRGGGLDERLAAAFEDAGAPALLIGMDTPQVTPDLLAGAVDELARPGIDAVLGRSPDGGWWAAGLTRADARAFVGVPMSTHATADAQLDRWRELGLRTRLLPELRDVDTFADALAVAADAPGTRFARTLQTMHA